MAHINKNNKLKDIKYLLTPMLFVAYPILFLYSGNMDEVPFSLVMEPLILALAMGIAMFFISRLVLKDTGKAAALTSVFWILFFLYGRAYNFFDDAEISTLSSHRYLLTIWLVIFGATSVLILRVKKINKSILTFATLVGGFLVVTQLFTISQYLLTSSKSDPYAYLENPTDKQMSKTENLPDIYYIMLDSYPRSDTLKEYFGYDNSPFDDALKTKGFFVASKSHSNYNQTSLSVPSALNMSYLKDLKTESLKPQNLISIYKHSKVWDYLKSAGYSFINNSNLYATKFNKVAKLNVVCGKSNEFNKQLIDTTALKPFGIVTDRERSALREDAACTMNHIKRAEQIEGPQFIFTHLLPPHPPYLFGENGEDASEINLSLESKGRWLQKDPYVAQLKYVNRRVLEIVSEILSKSKTPPIIIIQSDHGTLSSATQKVTLYDTRDIVLTERSRTYIGIYLPESCDKNHLYSKMTSVNTFRSVFNACFGAGYEILPDKIYYVTSKVNQQKNFVDITKNVGE